MGVDNCSLFLRRYSPPGRVHATVAHMRVRDAHRTAAVTDCNHIRMVTFSRQLGSGGEAIAQATAAALGFRYVDREVITRAAQDAEVPEDLVSDAEHIPSLRRRMLQILTANPGLAAASWFQPASVAPGPFMTSAVYRGFIEDVVREIAAEGDAVILGHAGQFLLRERWDTLKVLITGSPARRIHRVQAMLETHDESFAEKTITDWDSGRRAFYDRCYRIDWLSPTNYDVCLNTDHMTETEASELIIGAARRR